MRLEKRSYLAVDLVVAGATNGHQVCLIVRFLPRREKSHGRLVVHVNSGRAATLTEPVRAPERLSARRVPSTGVTALRGASGPHGVSGATDVLRLPCGLAIQRAERTPADLARTTLKGRPALRTRHAHPLPTVRARAPSLRIAAALERAEAAPSGARCMHHRSALLTGARPEDLAPSRREGARLRAEALRSTAFVERASMWREVGVALLTGRHARMIAEKRRPCDVESGW
jgi:hypothetical protein